MKKIFIFLSLLILSLNLCSAFFPISHEYVSSEIQNLNIDSNLLTICKKNINLCFAGDALDDVSVVYYYTNFKRYSVTHSPAFCRSLLDNAISEEEMACAIGGCLHQAQDLISHSQMVPYAIRHTLLPNGFIHPFAEQHLDNVVLREHPEAEFRTYQKLEDYYKCVPLFKRVLFDENAYSGVDLDGLFAKFVSEVTGGETGYDLSFNNITAIPFMVLLIWIGIMILLLVLILLIIFKFLKNKHGFWLWLNIIMLILFLIIFIVMLVLFIANLGGKAFQTFTVIIKPISNFVPIGNAQGYLDKTMLNTKNFFTQGESWLYNTDSSGFNELSSADKDIFIPQIILIIVIFSAIALFIYLNLLKLKSNKSNEI